MKIGEYEIRHNRYFGYSILPDDQERNSLASNLENLQLMIPEFKNPHRAGTLITRLNFIKEADLLVAQHKKEGSACGFLFSYPVCDYGMYLWLGGIAPEHRNNDLMTTMLGLVEIINPHIDFLRVKTHSEFVDMQRLLQKEGFDIFRESKDKEGRESIEYIKWKGYPSIAKRYIF